MRAIDYTDKAENDLAGILRFTVSTWGAGQANHYLDGLEQLTARLAEQPAMGSGCGDLAKELRALDRKSVV